MREIIELERDDETFSIEVDDTDVVITPEFFNETGWGRKMRSFNSNNIY